MKHLCLIYYFSGASTSAFLVYSNEFLVSKETVVLRRWERANFCSSLQYFVNNIEGEQEAIITK